MRETSQPKHSPWGGGGGGHLLWQCIRQRCGNKLYFCGGPFSPHVVNLKDDRKKTKKGATILKEMMSYLISSSRTAWTANLFWMRAPPAVRPPEISGFVPSVEWTRLVFGFSTTLLRTELTMLRLLLAMFRLPLALLRLLPACWDCYCGCWKCFRRLLRLLI